MPVRSACLLVFVATASLSLAQDSGADPITPEQINRWIGELDNDEFSVREKATEALAAGELVTLPRLVSAAKKVTGEPRERVFRALTLMSKSEDPSIVDAIETAIAELAESEDSVVARNATRIVDDIHDRRTKLAVQTLRAGGLYAQADGTGKYTTVTNNPGFGSRFVSKTRNEIEDDLLAELRHLPDLVFLSLRDSGIGDAGLAHIATVTGLTHLDINGTVVTDEGLGVLAKLPNLTYFSLKSPKVRGEGLENLRAAEGLTALQLCGESADDHWMAAVEPFRRIGFLELNGTSVSGKGLAAIEKWSQLNEAFLNQNKMIDDAGLPYLADKTKLTWVELTHTAITQEGFDEHLRDLPNVKRWGVPKGVVAPEVERK